MLHMVILIGPYGPKEPVDWVSECAISDLTRKGVKDNIVSGQWDDVKQIIEVNVTAGTSRDVTAEIAQEIASTYDSEDQISEELEAFFIRNNAKTW